MIRRNQSSAIWHPELGAVSEYICRLPLHQPATLQVSQVTIKRNLAQGNYYFHMLQARQLAIQKAGAVPELLRGGLVSRRRAAHYGGDVTIAQHQAITFVRARRLRGEPGIVQHRIHEVSRSISREWSSGAVGAVRARRQ